MFHRNADEKKARNETRKCRATNVQHSRNDTEYMHHDVLITMITASHNCIPKMHMRPRQDKLHSTKIHKCEHMKLTGPKLRATAQKTLRKKTLLVLPARTNRKPCAISHASTAHGKPVRTCIRQQTTREQKPCIQREQTAHPHANSEPMQAKRSACNNGNTSTWDKRNLQQRALYIKTPWNNRGVGATARNNDGQNEKNDKTAAGAAATAITANSASTNSATTMAKNERATWHNNSDQPGTPVSSVHLESWTEVAAGLGGTSKRKKHETEKTHAQTTSCKMQMAFVLTHQIPETNNNSNQVLN